MAKASTHESSNLIKLIIVGPSGTGKTGSLISLVKAGYNIRMLDMDNGTDALRNFIQHECPERLDQLDYITLRDKMKSDAMKGAAVSGRPKAYIDAIKYLDKWDDDSIPAEWGPDTIFVLDSLTLFGRAAMNWAIGMNPGAKDGRQWYGAAQDSILRVLDLLTSAEFNCNVIVMSHIDLVELPDGTTKGFASSIGKALGPKIPAIFNTMLIANSKGQGDNMRRELITLPTAMIEAKNPRPFDIPKSLPLETGLATIFEKLKAASK